jgi:hypothetical protein
MPGPLALAAAGSAGLVVGQLLDKGCPETVDCPAAPTLQETVDCPAAPTLQETVDGAEWAAYPWNARHGAAKENLLVSEEDLANFGSDTQIVDDYLATDLTQKKKKNLRLGLSDHLTACRAACDARPDCGGYYSTTDNRPRCYLKRGVYDGYDAFDPGALSYRKPPKRHTAEFVGDEVSVEPATSPLSFRDCMRSCDADIHCGAVQVDKDGSNCAFVKSKEGQNTLGNRAALAPSDSKIVFVKGNGYFDITPA